MMKSLTLILALTLSVMFSSTSFAGWTKVGTFPDGGTFYLDFESIRKHGGYVYYWDMVDNVTPNKWGTLSEKTYRQADCKVFRSKLLTAYYYTQPMAEGTPYVTGSPKGEKWHYAPPNSSNESILKKICSR